MNGYLLGACISAALLLTAMLALLVIDGQRSAEYLARAAGLAVLVVAAVYLSVRERK